MASSACACSGAACGITSRDFTCMAQAPRSLVLPNVATSAPGPVFNRPQLVFAGIVSLVLYVSFVFVQTVRHRDYFLPIDSPDEEAHAPVPSNATALISLVLLVVALI